MSKVSVLVVDDATFIRDLVKKGLRDHFPGVQIEEAINGRKAQQMLSRQVVDLILCDWEMPEMSGLELLTWCREQDNLKTTPFIMVTGDPGRGLRLHRQAVLQRAVGDQGEESPEPRRQTASPGCQRTTEDAQHRQFRQRLAGRPHRWQG